MAGWRAPPTIRAPPRGRAARAKRRRGASAWPRAPGTPAAWWRPPTKGTARRARRGRAMRSSEVGSAQCKSSKAITTGCDRAPARTQAVIAASCRRRNSSGGNFARRSSRSGMSTSGASRGAFSAGSRPISLKVFSRSLKRPSSACRCRRSGSYPIPRSGEAACSEGAARRPIRPRCAASRRPCAELLD